MRLFLCASGLLVIALGCSGGEATPEPTGTASPAAPAAPTADPGYFVWYNPGKTLYRSSGDAATWTAVAGTFPPDLGNYYISLTSDAGGRLYAGKRPDMLFQSGDGGKTWGSVTQVTPNGGTVEYKFCGGAADELFGVGSDGSGVHSTDAGQTWTVRRVAAVGASGAGDGFNGACAFSESGEILVDGWYFDPPGPVTATSKDQGATWTVLPRAANNTSTDGLGWAGGKIFYVQHGGYTGAKVSRFDPATSAWTEGPELKGQADREWALTAFATDGTKVVGWENASKGPAGPVSAFIQISDDGGATFRAIPGPVAADPTPDLWDEYLAMGWNNGKTPAAMPAPKAAAAPAVVDSKPTEKPAEKPAAKPAEKPAETTPAAKPAETKPAESKPPAQSPSLEERRKQKGK